LSEKSDETKSIIKVTQGVDEGGVSVLDYGAECDFGSLLEVVLGKRQFAAAEKFFVLFEMRLDIPELGE
jgi:hypothetical protein